MNILYLIPNHNMNNKCCGVTKKIMFQKQALAEIGFKGDVIYYYNENLIKEDLSSNNKRVLGNEFKERNKQRYMYNILLENYLLEDVDLIYIRYPRSRKEFISFMKAVKAINSKIKIFVEIVTYPYDEEEIYSLLKYKSKIRYKISGLYRICEDRINRKKLNKYVDRIVTFSEDKNIFGVKTINTSNGIAKEIIGCKSNNKINGTINIIGVGGIAKHHGYDRILYGMRLYLNNNLTESENIIFHIVGDGVEISNLKSITNENLLNNNVIFHGFKSGEELEEIYKIADIAIGSIGRHRNGIFQLADLKSREYCAKGIPFIKTVKDLDFEDFKYCLTIEANDNAVNIAEIISFWDNIKSNKNYKQEMYDYAKRNLTWEIKLSPIINELK